MTDDNRLGAFAVPGWEAQASQFVTLVQQLANSANASLVPQIEKQIQHIQREPAGWLIGFYCLSQDDPYVRFYGALTLTVKINSQWDTLGDVQEGPSVVLDCLRARYVRLTNSADHAIVLRKLSSSLTAYCLHPASDWETPVRDLLLQFAYSTGNSGAGASLVEIWQSLTGLSLSCLRSLLWFSSTWVEEANKFDAKTAAGAKICEKVGNNQGDVWCLIYSVLQIVHMRSNREGSRDPAVHDPLRDISDHDLIEISKEAINTALSWTKMSDSLSSTASAQVVNVQKQTVQLIATCFWIPPLAEPAIEYISYIVESAPIFQHHLPKETLKAIIQSPSVSSWLETLADEGDAPEGVRMATFIDALVDLEDLSSPEWVIEGSLDHIIPILHAFLQVPGVPGPENAVASISLDVWTRIADGLADWVGTSDADKVVISELQRAVVEIFPKTRLPEDELKGQEIWDQDERTKFSSFRRDYDDFLMACYSSTSDFIVSFVHQNVLRTLENGDWAGFETSAYNLGSLAETVTTDENRDWVYRSIYESQKWQMICSKQLAPPLKARQSMVNLIAASTKFLQRHEEHLIPCMEFLFSGLSDKHVSWLASDAIQVLCNSRRTSLTPALPQLFSVLHVLDQIDFVEQRRIFTSIAAIIQALPSEEAKLQPLKDLLQVLFRQGGRLEEMRQQQDENTLTAAAGFIKSLAGIGRGLRAPEEAVVALDESPNEQSSFWTSGPGAEVQSLVLQALTQILQAFPSKEATAAACEVFKAGYTEKDPFAFRFPPSVSVQFLVPLIHKDNTDIAEILRTTTSFLASHAWSPAAIQSEFEQIVMAVSYVQRQLIEDHAAGQPWTDHDFSYSSLDMIESILLRYCHPLLAMGTQDNSKPALPTIFEFALLCLRNPDILPRRSAAKFWATAFDLSGYNSRLASDIAVQWDQEIQPVLPHFAGIVLQLISGECARSEIDIVSMPLRRFVEKQYNQARNILKSLIEDPTVFPASAQANVNSAARQAFIQKLLTLRGVKKSDSIVREFWVSCRGTNFAYTS